MYVRCAYGLGWLLYMHDTYSNTEHLRMPPPAWRVPFCLAVLGVCVRTRVCSVFTEGQTNAGGYGLTGMEQRR